jgi:hypothetical protein
MMPNALTKSSGSLSKKGDQIIEGLIAKYPNANPSSLAVLISNSLKENRIRVCRVRPDEKHVHIYVKGSEYIYRISK